MLCNETFDKSLSVGDGLDTSEAGSVSDELDGPRFVPDFSEGVGKDFVDVEQTAGMGASARKATIANSNCRRSPTVNDTFNLDKSLPSDNTSNAECIAVTKSCNDDSFAVNDLPIRENFTANETFDKAICCVNDTFNLSNSVAADATFDKVSSLAPPSSFLAANETFNKSRSALAVINSTGNSNASSNSEGIIDNKTSTANSTFDASPTLQETVNTRVPLDGSDADEAANKMADISTAVGVGNVTFDYCSPASNRANTDVYATTDANGMKFTNSFARKDSAT